MIHDFCPFKVDIFHSYGGNTILKPYFPLFCPWKFITRRVGVFRQWYRSNSELIPSWLRWKSPVLPPNRCLGTGLRWHRPMKQSVAFPFLADVADFLASAPNFWTLENDKMGPLKAFFNDNLQRHLLQRDHKTSTVRSDVCSDYI